MPFQSEKQRRYLHANHPEIAKRWERDYAGGGIAELNTQLNSLPEYYLPKNQGGRIGFNEGSGKTYDDWLNYRLGEILEGRIPVPFKEWKAGEIKFNKGGFIPSHQAGIYGLAEGGRTGFYRGSDRHAGTTSSSSSNSPGHPSNQGNQGSTKSSSTQAPDQGGHSRFDVGSGYYGEPKTTPTPKDDPDGRTQALINISKQKKRPTYIGDEDLEGQLERDQQIALNRLKYDRNLTKREREGLEVGLGLRQPKQGFTLGKALNWIATGAAVVGTGGAALGLGGNQIVQTAQVINNINKLTNTATTAYNFMNNTNFTKQELFAKIQNDAKIEIDKQQAEKDLIASLPKGHPERIQLEGLKKETITRDGPNGNGVETSIKIENIEEVNDAKTQLLKKYEEMDQASYAAWLRQQELEAKKQAYLRNFRQTYMSAQGGRVPAGYNTGGLSNLFRLKNV